MRLQTRSILSDILPQMVDAHQNLTSSMLLSLNRFFLSSLLWGGSLAMWEYHSFSDNNISIIYIISQNQWIPLEAYMILFHTKPALLTWYIP